MANAQLSLSSNSVHFNRQPQPTFRHMNLLNKEVSWIWVEEHCQFQMLVTQFEMHCLRSVG